MEKSTLKIYKKDKEILKELQGYIFDKFGIKMSMEDLLNLLVSSKSDLKKLAINNLKKRLGK